MYISPVIIGDNNQLEEWYFEYVKRVYEETSKSLQRARRFGLSRKLVKQSKGGSSGKNGLSLLAVELGSV